MVISSFTECSPLELKADMKKRELFKISKKTPTEHNIQAHKKIRNIVLSRQRQAERKHYKVQYDQPSMNKITKTFGIPQDF